jgi:hypothetical protein
LNRRSGRDIRKALPSDHLEVMVQGERRFLRDKKEEIKILTSKLISDITCLCKNLFEKGGQ